MNFKTSRTIMWTGILAGIIVMLAGNDINNDIVNPWLFGIGMAIFILSLLQAFVFYRCPDCGYSLMNVKGSIPKFCPKCGEELNKNSQGEM